MRFRLGGRKRPIVTRAVFKENGKTQQVALGKISDKIGHIGPQWENSKKALKQGDVEQFTFYLNQCKRNLTESLEKIESLQKTTDKFLQKQ